MQSPKTEAQQRLKTAYTNFVALTQPLTDEQFIYQPDGKWSVADTLQHLYLSARNLPRILSGPRVFFEQWPISGRGSKSFEAVAADYERILAFGIKAPASLSPRPDDVQTNKAEVLDRFVMAHESFADALNGWSEAELDQYQLPHPALGLITIQEMAYFTAHHIKHHQAIVF